MTGVETNGKGDYWNNIFYISTKGNYIAYVWGESDYLSKSEVRYIIKQSNDNPNHVLKLVDMVCRIRRNYTTNNLYVAARKGDYTKAKNILTILKRKDNLC